MRFMTKKVTKMIPPEIAQSADETTSVLQKCHESLKNPEIFKYLFQLHPEMKATLTNISQKIDAVFMQNGESLDLSLLSKEIADYYKLMSLCDLINKHYNACLDLHKQRAALETFIQNSIFTYSYGVLKNLQKVEQKRKKAYKLIGKKRRGKRIEQ